MSKKFCKNLIGCPSFDSQIHGVLYIGIMEKFLVDLGVEFFSITISFEINIYCKELCIYEPDQSNASRRSIQLSNVICLARSLDQYGSSLLGGRLFFILGCNKQTRQTLQLRLQCFGQSTVPCGWQGIGTGSCYKLSCWLELNPRQLMNMRTAAVWPGGRPSKRLQSI